VCEPKVRFLQVNGESLLANAPDESTVGLRQSLDTVNVRWDNIEASVARRRSQLDEAVRMADSFQDSLSRVMTWLNDMEKTMSSLSPVSRILSTLDEQRNELKVCQQSVGIMFTSVYALRVLRNHGLSMNRTCKTLVLCTSVGGFCSAADCERLDAFLRRYKGLRSCEDDLLNINDLFANADEELFSSVLANKCTYASWL